MCVFMTGLISNAQNISSSKIPRGQLKHFRGPASSVQARTAGAACRAGTHTGLSLQALQGLPRRDQEGSEAAQPIPAVEPLGHTEELPEHCGRCGLERRVQRRHCVLYIGVQGYQVLKWKRGQVDIRTGVHGLSGGTRGLS